MIDLLTGLVWVFLSVANPLFGSVPKGSQKEAGDFAGPLIWAPEPAGTHGPRALTRLSNPQRQAAIACTLFA